MRAKEFTIVEKKRRKRKPRWAAYGPGPFGGYGYLTGYSGDSSGDGGAVGEGWKEAEQLNIDLNSGWVGAENSPEGVLIYAEDIQLGDSKIWISFIHNLTSGKTLETKISDDYNGNVDVGDDDINYLIDDIVDDVKKYYGSTWEEISDELHGGLGVDEGWKDTLAGLALGAGVAFSGSADAKSVEKVQVGQGDTVYSIARAFGTTPEIIQKLNKLDKNFSVKAGQTLKVPAGEVIDVIDKPSKEKKVEPEKKKPAKIDTSKTLTGTTHEAILTKTARASGITDPTELAAFLAQCAHESHDFKSMVEYGGSLDFKKYDIKFNPRKANELGNKKIGDGARYKGRGYIQLTGRYNYKMAGKALGLPLEQKPELAEKPEVAAKIAVWFWKQRVQPNVTNFNDVTAVTKPINSGLRGLEDRKEAFVDFKKFKLAMR